MRRSLSGAGRAVLPLLVLAGCGRPGVVMQHLGLPEGAEVATAVQVAESGGVPVALPVSRVVVTRVPPAANAPANAPRRYAFTAVPEDGPVRFRVTPRNDFWSSNQLSIQHGRNSLHATNVGNVFTDRTAERVRQFGSIATTLVRTAAGAGVLPLDAMRSRGRGSCQGAELPDFTFLLDTPIPPGGLSMTLPDGTPNRSCFRIHVSRLDAASTGEGTIPRDAFGAMLREAGGRAANFWPVPACMRVQVRVDTPEGPVAGELPVTDPTRLRLFPMPRSGTLALHDACGADLTDKAADRFGPTYDALAEAATQAGGFVKALQSSNQP